MIVTTPFLLAAVSSGAILGGLDWLVIAGCFSILAA